MTYKFHYRRYCIPFRNPVRTAHGLWSEREGLILRLEAPGGAVGWGEAAAVPGFGDETADADEEACRALGDRLDAGQALPEALECLRGALASALDELSGVSRTASEPLWISALLPAGRAALGALPALVESGFRTFKWKVGVGDLRDELALLDDVCAGLPAVAKLRLDANGAWDRRGAERWLETCVGRPVEFVEQPVSRHRPGSEDLLLGLAGDYPTPVALDESVAGGRDLERWVGAGWPGVFVVKPSLLGNVPAALALLEKAGSSVVFSSALETGIGARSALRAAFSWRGARRAAGFGVWPIFADSRFDGPRAGPFISQADAERINPEELWNALS